MKVNGMSIVNWCKKLSKNIYMQFMMQFMKSY